MPADPSDPSRFFTGEWMEGITATPPATTRPVIFAIGVPSSHGKFSGVYFRWYGHRFRRLPDCVSKGPSESDPEGLSLWYSQLGRYNAERKSGLGAAPDIYFKAGTLVLGPVLPAEDSGYTKRGNDYLRPAMSLDLVEDVTGHQAHFYDHADKYLDLLPLDGFKLFEATGEEGWLATSLHEYWRSVPQPQRSAAGKGAPLDRG